jgi:two-component system chemotaxis response regulator CheY
MKKNILLIDDNKYLLDVFVIRFAMSLRNYRVLTARNGKQGIEILRSAHVEFVLTDLDMPEMDGYQFVEHCREHFPQVPVFVMSNECSLQVNERLRRLGITECIEKPFLVEEVTHRVLSRLKGEKTEPVRELAGPAGAYLLSIIPN